MISICIHQALHRAHYEQVDGSFCATVPGLRGVIALGRTLADRRAELAEVLEEWILVRIARGRGIPEFGGVSIRVGFHP